MALIRVTANEIKAKASGLRDLNNQFKTQVTNLENYEQSLASMWEGQAKDAFHNAFNNDKAQMDNFNKLIEQYCQTMEQIAAKYEQVEAQNMNTAQTRNY